MGQTFDRLGTCATHKTMMVDGICHECLRETPIAGLTSAKPPPPIVDQPPPLAAADRPAVWDLVVADMKDRDAVGRARYGTPLTPFNGRDQLVDAYQEVLDLAVYLRARVEEDRGRRAVPRTDAEWDAVEAAERAAFEVDHARTLGFDRGDRRAAHLFNRDVDGSYERLLQVRWLGWLDRARAGLR